MKPFVLRLKPDRDLIQSLKQFTAEKELQAACILTAVGSLKQASLRFADRSVPRILKRKFEIVSLTGTLSIKGLHLHLAIADSFGTVTGGHAQEGCLIYTTAEIVIGELTTYGFDRVLDRQTGYKELIVQEQETDGLWWRDRLPPVRLERQSDHYSD
jgi:predicted DNA-binding protein with PD1-like motif